MASELPNTVSKLEKVNGSGSASPISARALNGAKMNQISGSANSAPRIAAKAEKPTRDRNCGVVSFMTPPPRARPSSAAARC